MLKKSRMFIVFLLALIVFIAYNNCSKSKLSENGSLDESSSSIIEPYQIKTTPKPTNTIAPKSYTVPCVPAPLVGKTIETTPIPKFDASLKINGVHSGQKLTGNFDSECLLNNLGGIFSKAALSESPNIVKNKVTTKDFHSPSTLSGLAFEELSNADLCLISIEPHVEMVLFGTPAVAPNDPKYSQQAHLSAINHTLVYSNLFNTYNGINKKVKIAIVDTGLDVNHDDIKPNLQITNGTILGINAVDQSNDFTDVESHGTHVAGLAAAVSRNSIGVSGVLGENVIIVPVKVHKGTKAAGGLDNASIANGIRWAADQGVDVINLSLGTMYDGTPSVSFTTALKASITYAVYEKNVTVIAASGNGDTSGVGADLVAHPIYPAYWGNEIKGMMTVGSIDATTKAISSFSNYSPTLVEMLAPGSNGSLGILSTFPVNSDPLNLSTGGYAQTMRVYNPYPSLALIRINGTSMASPVVAGAAAAVIALAKSRGYNPTPEQIEKAFEDGALTNAAYSAKVKGSRYLDFKNLIDYVDQQNGLNVSETKDRFNGSGIVGISTQPLGQNAKVGNEVRLSVTPTSTTAVFHNYQWYFNDSPIQGATKSTYVIPAINNAKAGVYTVEISVGTSKVKSAAAEVYVGQEYCK